MKESSGSRRKKLEKIGFEELMGAAGMSGFGALLEPLPVRVTGGWRLPVELRVRFVVQGAALAEKLGRQNDRLRSLNGSMTRRVASLEQALRFLSHRRRHEPGNLPEPECSAGDGAEGLGKAQPLGNPTTPSPRVFDAGPDGRTLAADFLPAEPP